MKRFKNHLFLGALACAALGCTIQTAAAARLATITPTQPAAVTSTGSASTPTAAALPTRPTEAAQGCKVSTGILDGFLNLRAGPGTAYQVLHVLHEGDRVTVTNRAGGWIQVQTESGAVGWVYAQYCEVQR